MELELGFGRARMRDATIKLQEVGKRMPFNRNSFDFSPRIIPRLTAPIVDKAAILGPMLQ